MEFAFEVLHFASWSQSREVDVTISTFLPSGSGAHPASYPTCTGGSFPGVKRLDREADHLPLSTENKNAWCYTSTHQYVLMVRLLS